MEMVILCLGKSIYFLFGICLFIIVLSFINRVYILWLFNKAKRIKEPLPNAFFTELPTVTIQLPIYNEPSVVQRLINNICNIDYPRDKLEIQILDDSTDETKEIARELCELKRSQGINISQICRGKREGYKAGALHYGLETAKGEFIAIFDSDFLPPRDFLKKTIHFFTDSKMGWVQTSWAHLNENYSLLTQCIALFCDSMFRVESSTRSKLSQWGIFNGAGGIIRKQMINEAGGWHWDTITEDSDLSYRALTLGWNYITLTETTCPCELPPTLPAFIEQQIRWSKGNIQVVKKLLNNILFAKVTMGNKYDFISYLTNYLFFPAVTIFSILIMPNIILNASNTFWGIDYSTAMSGLFIGLASLLSGICVVFLFFKFGQREIKKNLYILYRSFIFIFMSVGLAPFITVAIFEGFFKKDTVFVRTPKFDITDASQIIIKTKQTSDKLRKIALTGMVMGAYMLASIFICLSSHAEVAMKYLTGMVLFFTSYFYFGLLLAHPNQKWLRNIFEIRSPSQSRVFEQSHSGIN